jgi:hydrogenase expression/formation protein HypE
VSTQDLGAEIPARANWAEDAVAAHVGAEHLTREEQVLERIERARARKPRVKETRITLAHGAGGKATHNLIEAVFLEAFRNPVLEPMPDAATLSVLGGRLAFTTDSFVVSPIFFPGGDIGELAVNGTVNDLAMTGARPLSLSAAFILEEGFPTEDLRRVVASMAAAAARAGVQVVTGDTKVVPKGAADGLFITTAGTGVIPAGRTLSAGSVRAGDKVLLSGSMGDHGMAVMLARGDLAIEADIASDTASISPLVELLMAAAPSTRWMRDATRGGVGTVCNELAQACGLGVLLEEERLPVAPMVNGACELLGIDPLYVANEGKFVAVVAPQEAQAGLDALRSHPLGASAAEIGEIVTEPAETVVLRTGFGGTRIVDMLVGDPLPRIC